MVKKYQIDSESPKSFDLVSPPSDSAVDGGGGSDHAGAHAWWSNFTGLDPVLSVANRRLVRPEHEQSQKQGQGQLFVAKLSDAPSPQIEPLDGHLQIDGEMIKTHAEWFVKWPKKFKIPLDPVQQESTFRANLSTSLPPSKIWILPILFPLQPLATIWVRSHHNYPLPSVLPTPVSPTCRKEMPSAVLCVYANQGT